MGAKPAAEADGAAVANGVEGRVALGAEEPVEIG